MLLFIWILESFGACIYYFNAYSLYDNRGQPVHGKLTQIINGTCPRLFTSIAIPALQAGRFVPPFKISRMTWIKPSFNWMMYRSGFATNPGQEIILAIDITREGFEWALKNSAFTSFIPEIHLSYEHWENEMETKPVRIHWDPERDWKLQLQPNTRAIQIGLSGEAVRRYINDWIIRIEDITPLVKNIEQAALIDESPHYPLPHQLEKIYDYSFTEPNPSNKFLPSIIQ